MTATTTPAIPNFMSVQQGCVRGRHRYRVGAQVSPPADDVEQHRHCQRDDRPQHDRHIDPGTERRRARKCIAQRHNGKQALPRTTSSSAVETFVFDGQRRPTLGVRIYLVSQVGGGNTFNGVGIKRYQRDLRSDNDNDETHYPEFLDRRPHPLAPSRCDAERAPQRCSLFHGQCSGTSGRTRPN